MLRGWAETSATGMEEMQDKFFNTFEIGSQNEKSETIPGKQPVSVKFPKSDFV